MKAYPDSTEKIFLAMRTKFASPAVPHKLPYATLNNIYAVCDVIRMKRPLMFHCLCDLLVGLFTNNRYIVYRDICMFVSCFCKDVDIMFDIKKALAVESKILNSVDKRVDEIHRFLSLAIFAVNDQRLIDRFTDCSKNLQTLIATNKKKAVKSNEAAFIMEGFDFHGNYLKTLG